MKTKLLLCLFILLTIPGISAAAELRTLEIEFAFTAPDDPANPLLGYRLYKAGEQICETDDPTTTVITCDLFTEDGTFDFTLTAYYSDDSQSPPSPPFQYTIGTTSITDTPPLVPEGSRIITYSWDQNLSSSDLAGYRMYMNNTLLCQTEDPEATSLSCNADLINAPMAFSVASFDINGVESPRSNILLLDPADFPELFPSDPNIDPSPLQAIINPTPSSGEAPLSASFAATDSTGNISTWYWKFGDGSTATGSSVSHTYLTPGIYNATLEIGDGTGATSLATITMTALPTTTPPPPEPPTAILSSSTAAGNAPLPVTFDGTSSTTDNPPIVSYSWTFGDGSQATGETTSHTYLTAGTYYTKLTVTDSKGLTATADTPVIILGTAAANEKPVAIISTSLTEGDAPMLAAFDGSQSTDPDGSIASYDWNFGDGTKGTGPTIQHTYIDPGDYTVSLEVTDNLGETAKVTKVIIINIALSENILNFEVGEITIDHEWVTVDFVGDFIQPIVIAGPPTTNGSDPVLVRIRNIDIKNQKFEIRLQEWDYLQNIHTKETLTYIVMEKGIYTLDSGIKIEASSFTGASRFQKVSLQQAYNTTPVILTQVMTENDTGAVTGRPQKSGPSSFEYKMQEQETTKNAHTAETIGYIAWEPGTGEIQGLLFEAGLTSESVTSNGATLSFKTAFPAPPATPLFIADMQTYEGRDTAALRTQDISNNTIQIMIDEEQSKDSETDHVAEVVGYLVIGSAAAATEGP